MTDATYIGKYGGLRALSTNLLSRKFVEQLRSKNAEEIMKMLGETTYKTEIDELSGLYKMPDLFESILNAHFAKALRNVYMAVPPLARPFVEAYASRWDIENIKTILSSKVLGYDVEQVSEFLTVSKNPVGIFGGRIEIQDYMNMLSKKDVESIVNYLAKFGYGTVMMKYLDSYTKTGNISDMVLGLDIYYYENLLQSLRFYRGDEGSVFEYVKALIDAKNITTVVKGETLGVKDIGKFMIKGGKLSIQDIEGIISGKLTERSKDFIWLGIGEAIERYKSDSMASHFEAYLRNDIYRGFLAQFSASSASLGYMVGYMIRSEIERDSLRVIWLNKYYNIESVKIKHLMLDDYIA